MSERDYRKLSASILGAYSPAIAHGARQRVDMEAAVTKLRTLTRDIDEATAYVEATTQLAMVGIRPEQLTRMARYFASHNPEEFPHV